ncbi:MAG: radical SAM protein [Thermodesulfovibrionales bacterium]
MDRCLFEKTDYLLSRETGTVYKDPGGRISVALLYPNTYSVGMSSLGFQGIYGLLNSMPDVVCERAFLPAPEDIDEHRQSGTGIFSMESKRPLADFDIVAFSVSFENDYPNVLTMLELSRIPLRSADRMPAHPLIIMGGVCAFYNPEPMAEFIDICFIGEAEEMLPEFIGVFRGRSQRDDLYSACLHISGLYIPRLYSVAYDAVTGQISGRTSLPDAPARIKKRTVASISVKGVRPVIITPEASFSGMYLAEAMRGCPWSCRFCVAGHIYKPVRTKDLAAMKAEISEALKMTKRVGLIGPSLSDYQHAEEVLAIEGVDFSITSLRASSRSGRIVSLMKGHKSVSIAPEAGTARLRGVINKKISEEDILEAAGMILDEGVETLRLYFMVGLPTETRDDINGIIALVKKIRDRNRRGFINLTASTFVPKPFTPFQWHPMERMGEVKERLKILKKGLSNVKGVKVNYDIVKQAYFQGVLSIGDRRSSSLIERTAHTGISAFTAAGRSSSIFRRKDVDEMLPWDFIDAGVAKERLWEEYQEALRS